MACNATDDPTSVKSVFDRLYSYILSIGVEFIFELLVGETALAFG